MNKNLQKHAKLFLTQRKAITFILCIIAYIIGIITVKQTALAVDVPQQLNNVSANLITTIPTTMTNSLDTESDENNIINETIFIDKATYYREMYGSKDETSTVTVNGHEFDYIPGAPYSVYESMANALDNNIDIETITIQNEEYLSKNNNNIESVTLTAETTIEESELEEPIIEDNSEVSEAAYVPSDLRYLGVINWNGHRWTYYSEKVLPGGGLNIPGRYTDENFVCDENGYICLAADPSYISYGTVIDTPFGRPGKIYDSGCAYGTVDVYVGW